MLFFSAVAAQSRSDGSDASVGKLRLPSCSKSVLSLVVRCIGKPQPVEAALWWQAPTAAGAVAGLALLLACKLNGSAAMISSLVAVVSCSFAYREFVRPLKWKTGNADLAVKQQELQSYASLSPSLTQQTSRHAQYAPPCTGCSETEREIPVVDDEIHAMVPAQAEDSLTSHLYSSGLCVVDELVVSECSQAGWRPVDILDSSDCSSDTSDPDLQGDIQIPLSHIEAEDLQGKSDHAKEDSKSECEDDSFGEVAMDEAEDLQGKSDHAKEDSQSESDDDSFGEVAKDEAEDLQGKSDHVKEDSQSESEDASFGKVAKDEASLQVRLAILLDEALLSGELPQFLQDVRAESRQDEKDTCALCPGERSDRANAVVPKPNLVEKQLSIAMVNKFDTKISQSGPLPSQGSEDDRFFIIPRKVSCPPLKVALLVAPRREALGGNTEHRARRHSAHLPRESRPTPTRGMLVQMQQQVALNMTDHWKSCERELQHLSRCLDECSRAPCGSSGVLDFDAFKSDCQALSKRLEALAEDALESGCRRDAFGAMDIFGEATAALDAVAGLIGRCARVEAQHDAPGCADPIEWGVISEALSSVELVHLRELMQEVETYSNHRACGGSNREPSRLLRFLRAKSGDVKAAAEMYGKSLDWRAESGIEEKHRLWKEEESAALTLRVTLMNRFKIHSPLGRDKYGIPVLLFRWSVFDVVGAERELGTSMVIQIMLSLHEDIAAEIHRVARHRQQIVPGAFSIWDIGNYGKVPHWWSRMLALARFLPKVASILESNYPELVRKVVVVRCGAATKALIHAVTPLMPPSTFSKCQLCGWRCSEWLPTLQEEAPDIDVPLFLASDASAALESASPAGGIWPVSFA